MDVVKKKGGGIGGKGKRKQKILTAVRKSTRKCEKVIERERLEGWKEKVRRKQTVAGLKVVELEGKGRGIIITHYIPRGTMICEYEGILRTRKEGMTVEKDYERDEKIGCYVYYFTFRGEKYCVDATIEDGTIGRLINHARNNANLKCQIIEVDGEPHLIFITRRDIAPKEELLYDYGDRDVQSLNAHPWLKH